MPDTAPSQEEISELFVRKIRQKNFWACLFSDFEKVCDPTIPTLQVELTPDTLLGLSLAYNPDFLRRTFNETDEISLFDFYIAHEGTHVIQRHIHRWIYYLVKKLKVPAGAIPVGVLEKANQAADLAINSQCWKQACKGTKPAEWDSLAQKDWERKVKRLLHKENLCWPETFGVPPDESMEQYLDRLLMEKEKPPEVRPTPRHSWIDAPPRTQEARRTLEHLDKILQRVVQKAVTRFEKMHGAGSTPGGVVESLHQAVEEPPKIPWEVVVRRLLTEVSEEHDTANFSRPNKRLLELQPEGVFAFPRYDANPTCRIAFLVDTSGSMGLTTELREAMNLILAFLQYQKASRFWVVNADTCVAGAATGNPAVFDIRKRSDIPTQVWGRGGTDFCAPIDWVTRHLNPTAIFYATDGQGPGPIVRPSVPLMWFLTKNGRIPYATGDYQTTCAFGGAIRISTGEVLRRAS